MQIEWLEGLETKVREAAGRLEELREDNRELAARVEELETELTAAGTARAGSNDGGSAGEGAAGDEQELRLRIGELETQLADHAVDTAAAQAAWEREREEIRGRVESLTLRLEELLGV